jgi:glycosyltransferase involved in cell wall biosynthesis
MGTRTPTLKKIQPFNDVSVLFPKDERIIFTGRLSRDEATKLIAEANILFTPSRREGCPMALLEGMRVGTISIVADYKNANKEIINNGCNGFVVKHNDIKGFVYVIKDIISNHQNYLDIYDNNYNTYLSKLSFPVWKEKMDEIIINEKEKYHSKRKTKINKYLYLSNLLRYKLISINDSLQRSINEYFKSGLSIFFLYLRR